MQCDVMWVCVCVCKCKCLTHSGGAIYVSTCGCACVCVSRVVVTLLFTAEKKKSGVVSWRQRRFVRASRVAATGECEYFSDVSDPPGRPV